MSQSHGLWDWGCYLYGGLCASVMAHKWVVVGVDSLHYKAFDCTFTGLAYPIGKLNTKKKL